MKPIKSPVWMALLNLLLAAACVVTIPISGKAPTPLPPTPDLALTGQAQTETAIPTVTATYTLTPLPTDTPTATLTLFPTITPLPTATLIPSITPTFVGIAGTVAGLGIPMATLTEIAATPEFYGDPKGSKYSCALLAQKPERLTVYGPKKQVTAWWDLQNVGQEPWLGGVVSLSLVEGQKLTKDRFNELPRDVGPGELIRLKMEIITPTQEGIYNSTWGLMSERLNRHFCFFKLTIVVTK